MRELQSAIIFKTKKAVGIEEALIMRTGLKNLKNVYETQLQAGIEKIRNTTDLPEETKATIEELLNRADVPSCIVQNDIQPLKHFKLAFFSLKDDYGRINRDPEEIISEELQLSRSCFNPSR